MEDKTEEPQEGQQQHTKRDPRYYIADELLQTEKNYVSILTTIVKVKIYCINSAHAHKDFLNKLHNVSLRHNSIIGTSMLNHFSRYIVHPSI